MADTASRAEPAGTTETVTTAAPSSAASSLPTVDSEFAAKVEKASNPADIAGIMRDLARAPKATPKPAEPATAKEPEEAPAAGETPADDGVPKDLKDAEGNNTAPPSEGLDPAAPADPDTTPADPEAEPTEPESDQPTAVTPSTANKIGLRLSQKDEVGRLATAYLQRNRDWTLEQAMDAAKTQLGVRPQQAQTEAPAKPAPLVPGLPDTIPAVDAEQDRLEDAKAKAATELNLEEVAKIDRQLRKLDRHRADLQRRDAERAEVSNADFTRQFNASNKQATDLYAFASDQNSVGGKRMIEIEDALEATRDPLFHDPNKPLIIAQMVAAELRIAPKTKGAPAAQAKPAAPTAPVAKKGVLPSGSSRTAPVSQNPQADLQKEIAAAKTPLDLRRVYEKHGLKIMV